MSVPRHLLVAAMAALVLGAGCAAAASPPATDAATTVDLAASNTAFDRTSLAVPAGQPFTIAFENREQIPHNVSIRGNGVALATDVIRGPQLRFYSFPPLPAGSYAFVCDLHPEMRGTLAVTEEGS